MSKEEKTEEATTIKRILVALDDSTDSLAALQAAASLAAKVEAELLGLYVEDANLLNLAGLPFAHEVNVASGVSHRLDSEEMERLLRSQAARIRRMLAQTAQEAKVKWSFRVARGQVAAELLLASGEADLLMLGRVSRPLSRRSRLGSTARAVAAQSRRTVLLMRHGIQPHHPIMVTYDGGDAAQRALALATQLAEAVGAPLKVLIMAGSPLEAQKCEQQAITLLTDREVDVRFQRLLQPDVERLAQTVQAAGGCVLVLSGSDEPGTESLKTLLEQVDCPVMLVR